MDRTQETEGGWAEGGLGSGHVLMTLRVGLYRGCPLVRELDSSGRSQPWAAWV